PDPGGAVDPGGLVDPEPGGAVDPGGLVDPDPGGAVDPGGLVDPDPGGAVDPGGGTVGVANRASASRCAATGHAGWNATGAPLRISSSRRAHARCSWSLWGSRSSSTMRPREAGRPSR